MLYGLRAKTTSLKEQKHLSYTFPAFIHSFAHIVSDQAPQKLLLKAHYITLWQERMQWEMTHTAGNVRQRCEEVNEPKE